MARLSMKSFISFGLPFTLVCTTGMYGMYTLFSYRLERQDNKQRFLSSEEMEILNLKDHKQLSLEYEFERMLKKIDLSNYKNKRISRPWEAEETN